jgi:hypothetical protein
MERPYYGAFSVKGVNIGRSNYHSLNLRAEQRFNRGMAFSANYTFSKSLDDVGGPNFSSTEGLGTFNLGTKRFQSVDNTPDTYGISTLDETHVLRGFYYLELPVGRGRQWLGHPTSLLGSVLDHVVGGWQLSGEAQLRSGRPVVMGVQNINVNNDWRVQITNGSYAPGFASVEDPRFTDPSQVFYSTSDVRPVDGVRRFDPKAVVPAQVFTYGTLPPIFPNLRHPGSVNYNLSLAKAFYLSGDRDAYLQFRMEALNIFNIRGYGNYDSTVGSINFGYITTAGNSPRAIQMAARLVF